MSWLRDAWVLLGLAFGQMLLTFVCVALVPYGYLVYRARTDQGVADNLQALVVYAEQNAQREVSGPELLDEVGAPIRALMESVPWFWIALVGSVVIYGFLGWWSGRLLRHPQAGGVLILGSVLTQQNIVMVPRNIEYWNVAGVSLSLPLVLLVIAFQFLLLAGGIMYQRGQALLKETKT